MLSGPWLFLKFCKERRFCILNINIYQGSDNFSVLDTDVTIVIDVIRAFTTSEVAFSKGVAEIIMVKETKDAFELKERNSNLILMGEVDALPISGFDFDNSPWRMLKSDVDLKRKTLVQRTTNGVKAVVNNFNPNHTLVTGFSNALVTAQYLEKYRPNTVSLIASHPSSDEDLACAEYIQALLENIHVDEKAIAQRIRHSVAAQKFFKGNEAFLPQDIELSSKEKRQNNFVMTVTHSNKHLIMSKTKA